MPYHPLLKRIDDHLHRTGVSPTRFGRDSVGDPRIVFDLRAGRRPRARLERRIAACLDAAARGEEARSCSRP